MTESLSRRETLHLLIAAASAGGAVAACSGGAGPAAFGDVAAGNVSAITVGSLKLVSGAPAILARDANGLYAMTTTCTHQSCDMSTGVSNTGVYCSCHGSKFDTNGNVTKGPANSPLEHFAVSVDTSGNITVHGGSVVDASVRTAV
jgi:cytochrome b6-f complex iron-sulfur subunit